MIYGAIMAEVGSAAIKFISHELSQKRGVRIIRRARPFAFFFVFTLVIFDEILNYVPFDRIPTFLEIMVSVVGFVREVSKRSAFGFRGRFP